MSLGTFLFPIILRSVAVRHPIVACGHGHAARRDDDADGEV
jgi:hypothetical protein